MLTLLDLRRLMVITWTTLVLLQIGARGSDLCVLWTGGCILLLILWVSAEVDNAHRKRLRDRLHD